MSQLKELVPNLIKATTATRIVIDGLDECGDKDQKQILQELTKLCGERCKVLISSRDGGHIGKVLKKRRIIAFRDRRSDIDNDIRLYASQTLSELREQFGDEIIDEIKQTVVEKADGAYKFESHWQSSLLTETRHVSLGSSRDRLPPRMS
jgi:hypothetical protein